MNTKNLLFKIIPFILVSINSFGHNNRCILSHQQNNEWNIISEVPNSMTQIVFTDSTQGWVIGSHGEIYATEDGGKTWHPQNSGTENKLSSIYFLDDKTGFVSGLNRTLIYTNNKGNTWTPIQVVSDSGTVYNSLSSDADNNLYFISNYGEIFCSEDSGATWYNKYNFDFFGFNYLNFSNHPICFAKQMWMGVLYKSTDGGNVWEEFYMPTPWFNDPYFLNGDIGWVTDNWYFLSPIIKDSISIYMTTDGGETWIRQSSLQGINIDHIEFLNMFEGWALMVEYIYPSGSILEKIYYTSDSGQSWICQFESDSIGFISDFITDIFFLDNRNAWAVTYKGKIFKYSKSTEGSVENFEKNYPDEYILYQNYPNPFNSSTTISYSISKDDRVSLKVYNMLGNEIVTLVNVYQKKGKHTVSFQTTALSSGIYFYRLQVGNHLSEMKKMILLK